MTATEEPSSRPKLELVCNDDDMTGPEPSTALDVFYAHSQAVGPDASPESDPESGALDPGEGEPFDKFWDTPRDFGLSDWQPTYRQLMEMAHETFHCPESSPGAHGLANTIMVLLENLASLRGAFDHLSDAFMGTVEENTTENTARQALLWHLESRLK